MTALRRVRSFQKRREINESDLPWKADPNMQDGRTWGVGDIGVSEVPADDPYDRIALRKVLSELSMDEMELMRLRFDEAWELGRIGRQLGICAEAVRQRINRVLKKLRRRIESISRRGDRWTPEETNVPTSEVDGEASVQGDSAASHERNNAKNTADNANDTAD